MRKHICPAQLERLTDATQAGILLLLLGRDDVTKLIFQVSIFHLLKLGNHSSQLKVGIAMHDGQLHESLGLERGVVQNKIQDSDEQLNTCPFWSDCGLAYDLLVSDMKMDPVMVADVMTDVQSRLRPDGALIATLKLPKKGNPLPVLDKCLEKIRRAYTVVQARQLYFNRHEVTVLGRPALNSDPNIGDRQAT